MLRSRISTDITELNGLHTRYAWIPNEHTIRPTSENLEAKYALMTHIQSAWPSLEEYIRRTILASNNEWVFHKSMFPYNIEQGNHYVLWNSKYRYEAEFQENDINTILHTNLKELVGSDEFDFAWYKNPKPSVPQFYHIQVFWIHIPRLIQSTENEAYIK
jgi:hypothetical protein